MNIPLHNYILKFKQTEEILNQLAEQNRVKKYLDILEKHDPITFEHSLRAGLLSIDIGIENNLENQYIELLGYGAILHDIGKSKISSIILSKESRLTTEEYEAIKEHVRFGYEMVNEFGPKLKKLIISHHEYQTESYPRKANDRRENNREQEKERRDKEDLIKQMAQIIAVSDTYDALRSKRPYQKPKDKTESKEILAQRYIGNPKYAKQVLER